MKYSQKEHLGACDANKKGQNEATPVILLPRPSDMLIAAAAAGPAHEAAT